MKRNLLLVICLTLVVIAAGATGCSREVVTSGGVLGDKGIILSQQSTGIWVSGEGEVSVVPDVAILNFGVEAQAATVAEAQRQAAEAMEAVMAELDEYGIDEKDIKTQRYSIYPVRRWRDDEEILIGYRVTNMVTAKIRKVDDTGIIIDAVAKVGGDFTRIRGISFDVKDRTPYYEEARTKAMKDAKNKAIQLANLAGVGLGKATYVSEGAIYWPSPVRDFLEWEGGAPVPAAPTPISPGELKLTVNIQVIYEII